MSGDNDEGYLLPTALSGGVVTSEGDTILGEHVKVCDVRFRE